MITHHNPTDGHKEFSERYVHVIAISAMCYVHRYIVKKGTKTFNIPFRNYEVCSPCGAFDTSSSLLQAVELIHAPLATSSPARCISLRGTPAAAWYCLTVLITLSTKSNIESTQGFIAPSVKYCTLEYSLVSLGSCSL